MTHTSLPGGIFHDLPEDFATALHNNRQAQKTWCDISDKARNEWICWAITVKQEKTRTQHIERAIRDLAEGKRRPCCWGGCFHRTDKPVGQWAQKVLVNKQPRSK